MGNQESVEEVLLQEQDSEHLWEVARREENTEKGEGYCVFTTCPGRGTQAEKCKNALQVNTSLRCCCLPPPVLLRYPLSPPLPSIFVYSATLTLSGTLTRRPPPSLFQ